VETIDAIGRTAEAKLSLYGAASPSTAPISNVDAISRLASGTVRKAFL